MTGHAKTQAHNAEDFWAALALTRFILAFIILVCHTYYFTNPFFEIIKTFSGTAAVGAFFMISGYSIASSIGRNPQHFYERRMWRIYPSYAFALCLSFLPHFIYGNDDIFDFGRPLDWAQIVSSFCFMQGILVIRPNCNPVIWSLGIGEICYWLTPFFQKAKPLLIVGLIVISSVVYASNFRIDYVHWKYSQQLWGFATTAWIWLWLLGFAFYRWRGKWHWALLLLPMVLFCFNNESGGILAPVTVGVTAMLLTETIKVKKLSVLSRGLFLYLGDLSYPIYLLHVPLIKWVVKLWGTDTTWVQFLAIFLISDLVLRLIGRPLRRLNNKSYIDQTINSVKS